MLRYLRRSNTPLALTAANLIEAASLSTSIPGRSDGLLSTLPRNRDDQTVARLTLLLGLPENGIRQRSELSELEPG